MKLQQSSQSFIPLHDDNRRLANLCGPLDENLHQIEQVLDVLISRRGSRFTVRGKNASVTVQVLENFYNLAIKPLSIEDIHLGLVKIRHEYMPSVCIADGKKFLESNDANARQESSLLLSTRRPDLRGRTATQCEYLNKILSHDVTFGIGPAGTGKTYLAVACAIDALERDVIKRIILTRPAVEAGEHLGFLPGDLAQKVDPYLRPLYDALYELCGLDKTQKYFEKQMIEIAPLAYMRGRTLNHAFVILDEAQNTTPEQMKMFLTRIGFGSKAVVTGDTTQVDLPRGQKSGLHESQFILKDVYGIAFTRFTSVDVVRHPLVGRIVEAYDAHALAATYDDTEHQIKHCLRG